MSYPDYQLVVLYSLSLFVLLLSPPLAFLALLQVRTPMPPVFDNLKSNLPFKFRIFSRPRLVLTGSITSLWASCSVVAGLLTPIAK
jgi:hypothetical protein